MTRLSRCFPASGDFFEKLSAILPQSVQWGSRGSGKAPRKGGRSHEQS
nr:MAG TPA: hypothetical protein [Caudoviricetes sp.]